MSLINDMLRDLEKREPPQNPSPRGGAPVVTRSRNSRKGVIAIGMGLILLVLVWFGLGMFSEKLQSVPLVVAPATQPTVDVTHGEEKIGTVTTSVPPVVNTLHNVPDVPAVVSHADVIPMANGGGELSNLRLTKTDTQTTLTLSSTQFPQVQLIEPSAESEGLVVRFEHLQLGSEFEIPATAGSQIKRISLVPQKEALRLFIDLVPGTRVLSSELIDTSQHEFQLQIVFVPVEKSAEPVKPVAIAASPPPAAKKQQQKTEKKSPIVAKASKHIPVVAREKQAYQDGLEQLRSGQVVAAEASFVQALLVKPEFLDARLQLITLLQQQRKFVKAEKFLQQGLSLTPESPVLRKIYARQLLQEQRGRQAIKLLRAPEVPRLTHDLEYHALLAAALQGVGDYEASSSIYAQLIQQRPQEALWWLGMAVSLEQSGYREKSREAYQKALSLPGLRPDLQNYIQGRLQAL